LTSVIPQKGTYKIKGKDKHEINMDKMSGDMEMLPQRKEFRELWNLNPIKNHKFVSQIVNLFHKQVLTHQNVKTASVV
jgi:hypothetical protein